MMPPVWFQLIISCISHGALKFVAFAVDSRVGVHSKCVLATETNYSYQQKKM